MLLQHPLNEGGIGVGVGPAVVAYVRVDRQTGVAAAQVDALHQPDRFLTLDGSVGIPVEGPDGGLDQLVAGPADARTADGDEGGKAGGVVDAPQPRARTAVGESRDIDPLGVDAEGGQQVIQQAVEGVDLTAPMVIGGELGRDQNEGIFRTLPCVTGPAVEGDEIQVIPPLPRAVEEDDQGEQLLGILVGRRQIAQVS